MFVAKETDMCRKKDLYVSQKRPLPTSEDALFLDSKQSPMGWLRLVGSLKLYSAKETYNFKEPTNRSHPVYVCQQTHCTDMSTHALNSSVKRDLYMP